MKKLNRKGFTLVELLAVIIILAIVVGITIPAVLGTINNSKNGAMDVAVEAAQTWLEEQALVYNTDTNSVDATFTGDLVKVADIAGSNAITLSTDQIKAIGLKNADVTTVTVTPKGNGKACVEITKIPTSSQYYNTKYWNSDGTPKTGDNAPKNKSSHC